MLSDLPLFFSIYSKQPYSTDEILRFRRGKLQELVMDREAWACCDSWGRKESDTTERLN